MYRDKGKAHINNLEEYDTLYKKSVHNNDDF